MKFTQKGSFKNGTHCLQNKHLMPMPIKRLFLFFDSAGFITMDSHLRFSGLAFDHPMLLPNKHGFVELLVEHIHT